jgi:hypothetical protein
MTINTSSPQAQLASMVEVLFARASDVLDMHIYSLKANIKIFATQQDMTDFYNNLYQLSRIKGAALVKLIETNKVHPSLTLENTREFAEKYAPSKQSKTIKSTQLTNEKHATDTTQIMSENEPTTFNVTIEIKFSKKYGSQKQIDNALNWLNENLTDAVAKLK